jgi:AcrR family transcriptional regulator
MQDTPTPNAAERQRAVTRALLLDAAFALLREAPGETFSHEAVAARAGISARTVYRHFPTRSDLTAALWERLRDETGTRWPQTEREIATSLRRTFRQFEQYADLTRAAIAAAASTDYPAHGSAEGRAAFRRSLSDILDALPESDGHRLIAACVAMYSAPFWQMLRDRGLLAPKDAEEAAVTAMQSLIAAARDRAVASPSRTGARR